MQIDIGDILNAIVAALILLVVQRIVSSRDKRLEKMEAKIEVLEKSDHEKTKHDAVIASKVEDIKSNVQWIKDKIYDD